MPRARQKPAPTTNDAAGLAQYVKLENRLVLLAWINSLLATSAIKTCLPVQKAPPKVSTLRGGVSFITI